ncbi:carbohydrate ABC transporter permease [Candidatus Gracilibacteria bacterium]|nr:carbohydrate ABC transporter permease [Candidatus Gracilibacteria bacterium]
MVGFLYRRSLDRWLAYGVLLLAATAMIAPFMIMLLASLKPATEVIQVPPQLVPSTWQWGNYAEVLRILPIGQQLLNSAIVTAGVVSGWVVIATLAGYAFARLRFWGRDMLFGMYLGTLMIPFAVQIVPMYQLMVTFGWVDRLIALIVPWLYTAYGTFLLRQFFRSLPLELEEAAIIDGASRWGVLVRIAIPLARAPIGTLATFGFLYAWNSFLWPLIVISSPEKKLISQGLTDLQALYADRLDLVMAAAVLAILPTLLAFLLAQRSFIEGIATSGFGGR